MEELQSSEVLDREILEDARKKADRVLRAADQAAATIAATWKAKGDADIAALEKSYAARSASFRAETMARVPLDERRERSGRAERLLGEAMKTWLTSLPRDKLLSLFSPRMAAASEILKQEAGLTGAEVSINGLDVDEARALLARWDEKAAWRLGADGGAFLSAHGRFDAFPALRVVTGSVVLRLSIADVVEEALSGYRLELATALLGEEAAND